MNIKDLVEETGYQPKRKAATHGGEYASPCPFCKDGTDRFLIWPSKHNANGEYTGGRYSCRVCGKYGDAISFLRELDGLSYSEACVRLKVEPRQINHRKPQNTSQHKPAVIEDPSLVWKERASVFVNWCHSKLMNDSNALILIQARGFTLDSIRCFKIGYNPGESGRDFFRPREDWGLATEFKEDGKPRRVWLPRGVVIPTFSGKDIVKIKIRRSAWKEGDKLPKYAEVSGSRQAPSVFGNASLPYVLIVESELDALLALQFASDLVFCIALGGSTKPLDFQTYELLKRTPKILFCPDDDEAGVVAWNRWKNLFPNIVLALAPTEKSVGDAFLAGVDLREWIEELIKQKYEG